MSAAFIGICIAGFLLGCIFRVPAIIAASAAIFAGTTSIGIIAGWSLLFVALGVTCLLAGAQAGYLLGAYACCSLGDWSRVGQRV